MMFKIFRPFILLSLISITAGIVHSQSINELEISYINSKKNLEKEISDSK